MKGTSLNAARETEQLASSPRLRSVSTWLQGVGSGLGGVGRARGVHVLAPREVWSGQLSREASSPFLCGPGPAMLRNLTLDQISDWFTLGKTVTNVELLGGEPQAAVPGPRRGSRPPAWEPPAAG